MYNKDSFDEDSFNNFVETNFTPHDEHESMLRQKRIKARLRDERKRELKENRRDDW